MLNPTPIRSAIGHILRMATRPSYREARLEHSRLSNLPRYQPSTAVLSGKKVQVVDGGTYLAGIDEIFRCEVYKFRAEDDTPVIIDCGANIGLSIIYLKQLYPKSRILAFEADPNIFVALESNVRTFHFTDVELRNNAVWTDDSLLSFVLEGGASGHVAGADVTNLKPTVQVAGVRLRSILENMSKVDFLKLDIEGAETAVVQDCADQLEKVQNLFIEYHSHNDRPQQLNRLLSILAEQGFRYFVQEAYCPDHPFIRDSHRGETDFQINVYGLRNNLRPENAG